jgi:hypothetical protein
LRSLPLVYLFIFRDKVWQTFSRNLELLPFFVNERAFETHSDLSIYGTGMVTVRYHFYGVWCILADMHMVLVPYITIPVAVQ